MATDEGDDHDMLTPAETRRLILCCVHGSGEEGATKEDCAKVMAWAEQARINAACLEMVLCGEMMVRVVNDEVNFYLAPQDRKAKLIAAMERSDSVTDD